MENRNPWSYRNIVMLGFIAFSPTYRTMAYRVVAGIRKSSESTDVEYDGHHVALLRFNNDRIAAAIAKVEIDAGMAGCSIETGTDSVQ